MKYIAMLSGGQDSTAMVDLLLRDGDPVDYIIFCDTTFEFQEMYSYLEKFDNYIQKKYGKKITYLKPETTFESWVFGKISKGKKEGFIRGLPMITLPCFWKRESKVKPFEKWLKENDIKDYKLYIGYTFSEKRRSQVKDEKQIFPLINKVYCEYEVSYHLEDIDMINPLYDYFSRTGCSICPYQSLRAFYVLYKHYNKTWQYMKDIENKLLNMENVQNPTWKINDKLSDLEERFKSESNWSDKPDKACQCQLSLVDFAEGKRYPNL